MSHVFNESVWVWGHYRNNTSHTKFKSELCAVIIANYIGHHETVLNSVLEEVHHRSMHWSLLGSHCCMPDENFAELILQNPSILLFHFGSLKPFWKAVGQLHFILMHC